jgi:spore germination cell wall hydrolase CwlJ-like protein
MDCVADTVYYEARGEGEIGMRAVAHVIYNRANKEGVSPCIIVKRRGQFAKGPSRPQDKLWRIAKQISINPGWDLTRGATFFHNRSVRPYWIRSLKITFSFGGHIFYRKP